MKFSSRNRRYSFQIGSLVKIFNPIFSTYKHTTWPFCPSVQWSEKSRRWWFGVAHLRLTWFKPRTSSYATSFWAPPSVEIIPSNKPSSSGYSYSKLAKIGLSFIISIIDSNGINCNCTGAVRFEWWSNGSIPRCIAVEDIHLFTLSMAEVMNALPFGSLARFCPGVPIRQHIGKKREEPVRVRKHYAIESFSARRNKIIA